MLGKLWTRFQSLEKPRTRDLFRKPRLHVEHLEQREVPAVLSGQVYIDSNLDGFKQASEAGLGGVEIKLTGTDIDGDAVDQTTTTAANGNFSFTIAKAGTYTLTQTQPGGFLTAFETAGTAGGTVASNEISDIVLTQDQIATGYLFGEQGITVTGKVFTDDNANGILEAGEAGFGNILLTLTNTGTGAVQHAISDFDGDFTFTGLAPGNYTLTATNSFPLLGFSTPATQTINITTSGAPGGTLADQNFGLSSVSELQGIVYHDVNDNGIFDAGDIGINNVTMTLTGLQNNGTPVNTTITTSPDGTFNFKNLLAGTYSIQQTQPAGFDDGVISIGTAGGSSGPNIVVGINLGAGITATGYNFGERQVLQSSIAGTTFIDVNGDGQKQSNEPGLTGVVFQLTGTNDLGDAVNLSTTSDANGNFTFNALRPGTYTLTQTQPQNFANGTTTAGTAGGTVVGNIISNIVLGSGVDATGYLFGEVGNRALGQVFDDANGNGVLDAGEAGRAGVLLTLTNTTTNTTFNAVSDANGNFVFENLGPGNYTLTGTNPDANTFAFTTPGTLNFNIPNSGVVGGEVLNQNLGLVATSEVTGTVYDDINFNGIFDFGDVGIGNVQMRLQGTQNNGTSVNRTINTQANGFFRFTGVLPGTYSLIQTQPANFDDGTITVGSAGGTAATNSVQNIVIGAGIVASDYNFGEQAVQFASLSGRVFFDRNGDGFFQQGEQTLPGVVLTLAGTANNGDAINLTATTGSDGTFSFTNVRPGVYTLTQQQPTNFADGSVRAGTAGGIVGINSISNIVLGPNVVATDYLFSEIGNRIAGTVFDDLNGNAILDPGELGRSGITVTLTGAGQNLSTTTDANGFYEFTNLGPGTYTVNAVAPAGSLLAGGAITVTIPNTGLPGGEAIDRNIGLISVGSLAGQLFIDLNNDGIKQENEPGFSSLQISLTGVQANGASVTRSAATGGNGSFLFENLLPGTYTITPSLPPGVVVGQIVIGSAGGNAGATAVTGISLAAGQDATGYAFGLRTADDRSLLTGTVFLDRNRNRVLDPGDIREEDLTAGIEGVTIRLVGRDELGNAVNLTTTTDFFGNYSFTNLRAGKYRLGQIQPVGFREGRTFVGTLGGRARRNLVDRLTIAEGVIGSGYDFSEQLPNPSRKTRIASRYWT